MHLPVRYLSIACLIASAPFIAAGASVGQTENEVRREHGNPSSTISAGSKKILVYPAGRVILVAGKVATIEGDLDAKAPKVEEKKATEGSSRGTPAYIAKFEKHLIDRRGNSWYSPHLDDSEYILVYYSASWCPPCRKFTPKLVDFYKDNKDESNFELIFVSSDRDAKASLNYMKKYKMPWPAVKYDYISKSGLQGKGGRGIPSLVLMDRKGKIVSSTYKGSTYLGPDKVLKDLKKKL